MEERKNAADSHKKGGGGGYCSKDIPPTTTFLTSDHSQISVWLAVAAGKKKHPALY